MESSTHQFSEDVDLDAQQTRVRHQDDERQVEAHVTRRDVTLEQVHEFERLGECAEQEVERQGGEEARRVPHLHVVVVHDAAHRPCEPEVSSSDRK